MPAMVPGPAAPKVSLEFTEEMKGFLTTGEVDYQKGYAPARRPDTRRWCV